MQDLYFACSTCKTYWDAGSRWCYWTLEHPGIVRRGKVVSVESVLAAEEYWSDGQEQWLAELLPRVKNRLLTHAEHRIVYGEDDDFVQDPNYEYVSFFEWICDDDASPRDGTHLTPRAFIDRFGVLTWDDALRYVDEQLEREPWWWSIEYFRRRARKWFDARAATLTAEHESVVTELGPSILIPRI